MKVPKFNETDKKIRKYSPDALFGLMMADFAVHDVKHALEDIIVYSHNASVDLTEFAKYLAKHPRSLKASCNTAKAIMSLHCYAQGDNIKNAQAENSKSDGSSKDKSDDGNSDLSLKPIPILDKKRLKLSDEMDSAKRRVISLLHKWCLAGLNVVLIRRDGRTAQMSINTGKAIKRANLAFDWLHSQLMDECTHYLAEHATTSDSPNKPSQMDPVQQAEKAIRHRQQK